MENYTIYSNGIWERMLEKHSDLKDAAIKCNVQDNPEKAQKISQKYRHNFGIGTLSDAEVELGSILWSVEFEEANFLKQVVMTGSFHFANGADYYATASFNLVLADFESSFKDWYQEIRKRNMSENASFGEFYEVFLEIIKLKLEYKIPYTKLFIHKLLENSAMPKEDSLEIKHYLLEKYPEILPKVKCELIE